MKDNAVAALTLEQFRDAKRRGFPGWETAYTPRYDGATSYVEPVDARFGTPSNLCGTDPAATGSAFERWCAENLAGDHFLVAGTSGGLVYCQLESDAALVRRSFGAPSVSPEAPD
jgi:hypothetical protein